MTLENHSFDNIAGYWDFHPDIDNLRNISFCNEYTNPNWTVWGEPLEICAEPYETEVPLTDPDHNFAGVSYEIFRKWNPTKDDTPTMSGFIERQSEKYSETPGDASFVIKAYDEKKTALLAELAKNFAFFDSYVGGAETKVRDNADMLYSTLSTLARPMSTASLRLLDPRVVSWTTLTRLLVSGTM